MPASPKSSKSANGPARRGGTRGPANAVAILAAANRLVAERGDDFTTQDLIREADVALQTLYRYFGSKDQLLVAVIGEQISAHCQHMAAQAAALDDPVDRLRLYIRESLVPLSEVRGTGGPRFVTSQHWRLHQILPEALAEATRPFTDLVAGELEAARESGRLSPGDPERAAWLISRLVMTVFHHYAFTDDELDVDALADEVWGFCGAAIGAPVVPLSG